MTFCDIWRNGVARVPLRTSLIPQVVEWPTVPDDPAIDELFQERAAIREFDGGLSRADAEILADHDGDEVSHTDRRGVLPTDR